MHGTTKFVGLDVSKEKIIVAVASEGRENARYWGRGSRWQGGITKVGNNHIRRVLVESAWSYRHTPGVRRRIREKLRGLSPEIQAISWEAQNRLHKKYKRMLGKGKHKGTIVTSIARELLGFVWAIAIEVEKQKQSVA